MDGKKDVSERKATRTPYEILGVTPESSVAFVKKRYKELARRFHPDKCGEKEAADKYRLIQLSYVKILEEFKLKQIDKAFHELKMEFEDFTKTQPNTQTRDGCSSAFHSSPQGGERVSFQEAFNKEFEVNRKSHAFDRGYGKSMSKSDKRREDFSIPNKIGEFDEHKFNEHFDSDDTTTSSKHMKKLMKYTVPQPTHMGKSLTYTELGVDKVTDFSGDNQNRRSLHFMDYMTAHNTSKLIDKSSVRERTRYNSIEDVQIERTDVPIEMTAEERQMYDKYTQKQHLREQRLRTQLKEEDNEWASHHDRVVLLMSSYRK